MIIEWLVYFNITRQSPLASSPLDFLAASQQVVLQVFRIGPFRIHVVVLIVGLQLLELLLLSVPAGHHLLLSLLCYCWLTHRSTCPFLRQLHDYLGLLVLADVMVQGLPSVVFLADSPQGRFLRVEVIYCVRISLLQLISALGQ